MITEKNYRFTHEPEFDGDVIFEDITDETSPVLLERISPKTREVYIHWNIDNTIRITHKGVPTLLSELPRQENGKKYRNVVFKQTAQR